MRKGILSLTAAAAAMTLGLTACGGDGASHRCPEQTQRLRRALAAAAGKVGVILPDSKSSARWETADRKYLEEAFKAAGVEYDIQNAQGDKTAFQTIADQMITNGVKVLMIVNLDSGTGKAVLEKAKAQGVPTIDYDRLTLGGGAAVLRLLRQRQGRQAAGRGPRQVPDRQEGQQADRRRAQRLADRQQRHPVQERLRLGAQAEVRRRRVRQGPRPVRARLGQHAGRHRSSSRCSPDQRQDRRRAGRQRRPRQRRHRGAEEEQPQRQGPGHRPGRHRAGPAEHPRRRPVHDGLQGRSRRRPTRPPSWPSRWPRARSPRRTGTRQGHRERRRTCPSVLLDPQAIYKDNVKDVVADGFVTKDELCTGDFAAKCTEAGIS